MPVEAAEPTLIDPEAPLKSSQRLKEKQRAIGATEMRSLYNLSSVTDSLSEGMINGSSHANLLTHL